MPQLRHIVALAGVISLSGAPTVDARSGLTESKAIGLAAAALSRDASYKLPISRGCLAFSTEAATATYFDIAVRETHNANCGGDSGVSPVILRYRVIRKSGGVLLFDSAHGTYTQVRPV
jgi:hypothetical protein